MKKIIFIFFLLLPSLVFAQEDGMKDKFYKAKVVEIIETQETVLQDGSVVEQQNLKLELLEDGRIVDFNGIGIYDVVKKNIYKLGDKVLVIETFDFEGTPQYYITDYIRSGSLWFLAIAFVLVIFIVGGFKGLRSLISLGFSFLIIVKYIIPKILGGANPVVITIIGSFLILLLIIYITEGFKTRSHIAVFSILISLIITIFLSWFFVSLAKLSGLSSEETGFLINIGSNIINFKGLLLAGIIIGVLGVLDDVVVAQVATIEQIYKTDENLSRKKLFKQSYDVGISHVSSMTNTLFLAYAGVSMPILILFLSGQSAFSQWGQIINNEAIATEIVRTLAGSIGLILSVPIATVVAVWWLKSRSV